MTRFKKILALVLVLIISILLFFTWYQYKYSMDEVASFEVNSPSYNKKLLIATQGSEFKNTITKNIINHYKQDSIYIKVIDISLLLEIEPQDYSALIIMHTWESWRPPVSVERFINKVADKQSNLIVLTTSGQGNCKMENVDAITGESKLENTDSFTHKIIKKTNLLLKKINKYV